MQKIDSIRIYGSCDNVAMWSARQGLDPRTSVIYGYGGYYSTYNALRTITGGIKLTF